MSSACRSRARSTCRTRPASCTARSSRFSAEPLPARDPADEDDGAIGRFARETRSRATIPCRCACAARPCSWRDDYDTDDEQHHDRGDAFALNAAFCRISLTIFSPRPPPRLPRAMWAVIYIAPRADAAGRGNAGPRLRPRSLGGFRSQTAFGTRHVRVAGGLDFGAAVRGTPRRRTREAFSDGRAGRGRSRPVDWHATEPSAIIIDSYRCLWQVLVASR